MPIDYAKSRSHSRLKRYEQRRTIRTTLIIVIMMAGFMLLFGFLGINVLARLSLLLTRLRSTKPVTVNQDVIPPPPPQLSLPYEATASAVIVVKGFAEPESQIHLYLNGALDDTVSADTEGTFSINAVTLSPGLNRLYAVASDTQNNQSPHSSTATIILDQTNPEITLNQPAPGSQFYGQGERLITLAGQTEPQVRLSVNDQNIVVSSDGSFSTKFELQEGSNNLKLLAIDPAGNQSQTELNLNYSP